MADIELVIKIPEQEYNIIKKSNAPMTWVEYLIKKGTPLPKGHGRLLIISEDYVKEHMIGLDAFHQKFIGEVDLSSAIVNVIEADKENN